MAVTYPISIIMIMAVMTEARVVERTERLEYKTWQLAMNLNPSDGHIMDYTTGWTDNDFIGTYGEALSKDFLDSDVWNSVANYVAIVRHQQGEVDAVKVFRFKRKEWSLMTRFQQMDFGRQVETEGGPIQESISRGAANMHDDPIFSVGGDLAFNWIYTDNGHRMVMTGGNLSPYRVNDDNTHGLGNHFGCDPTTARELNPLWSHEISNIQNCSIQNPLCDFKANPIRLQGTDHGDGWRFSSGPVYGNYAIYISQDAKRFPGPGYMLSVEVQVEEKMGKSGHGEF